MGSVREEQILLQDSLSGKRKIFIFFFKRHSAGFNWLKINTFVKRSKVRSMGFATVFILTVLMDRVFNNLLLSPWSSPFAASDTSRGEWGSSYWTGMKTSVSQAGWLTLKHAKKGGCLEYLALSLFFPNWEVMSVGVCKIGDSLRALGNLIELWR